MYFDGRYGDAFKRVVNCHGCMRIGSRIDNQSCALITSLLDMVDYFTFNVRLAKFDTISRRFGKGAAVVFNISYCLVTINFWLSLS